MTAASLKSRLHALLRACGLDPDEPWFMLLLSMVFLPLPPDPWGRSWRARMATLSREGDMKFSTVNGTITVETPSSLDANVSLDSMHGGITSDFPVQITGKFGPRHAEGGRGVVPADEDRLAGLPG